MEKRISAREIIEKVSFLFASLFVGFIIFYIFEMRNTPDIYDIDKVTGTQSESESELLAQQSYYSLEGFQEVEADMQVREEGVGAPEDQDGEVLGTGGCNDFSDTGCSSRTVAFQPVCVQGSANVNMKGGNATDLGDGVRISKNSKIEIWKVTSPLAILSGIESTRYNTMAITSEDPAFPSASMIVDPDYVAPAYMAPGEEAANIAAIAGSTDDEKFSVHTQASIGGGGGAGGDGPNTATVEKELGCACEEFQPSDPSPEKPNKLGPVLANAYGTSVDPILERNYVDHDPACVFIDPNNIDLPRSDVFETCLNRRSAWDGLVQGVWGIARRLQCLADPSQCEKVELFGIIIDAPFGKNSQCVDGSCTDQYLDYSVGSDLSPLEINDYKDGPYENDFEPVLQPHYVTTPCKVRVDYGTVYRVPCLWDISPYWNKYQLEAQNHEPDDPDFPTFNEYWRLVEDASERRGAVCDI